jgi:hypothetical protein
MAVGTVHQVLGARKLCADQLLIQTVAEEGLKRPVGRHVGDQEAGQHQGDQAGEEPRPQGDQPSPPAQTVHDRQWQLLLDMKA